MADHLSNFGIWNRYCSPSGIHSEIESVAGCWDMSMGELECLERAAQVYRSLLMLPP